MVEGKRPFKSGDQVFVEGLSRIVKRKVANDLGLQVRSCFWEDDQWKVKVWNPMRFPRFLILTVDQIATSKPRQIRHRSSCSYN